MNFLDELNEVQRAAVQHTEGPVMIMAGPGSGKTRVLTYRIAYLLRYGAPRGEDGELFPVDPFRILALTFTNKAAKEMRERIWKITGSEAKNLWMGTFHSIFSRILRSEHEKINFPRDFTIYDSQDSKNLLKNIIKEKNLSDKLYKPGNVHHRISTLKNNLLSPEEYAKDPFLVSEDEAQGRKEIGEIYRIYRLRLTQSGAMDFDDLLFKTYFLFENDPATLYKYQKQFHYILIDEYQDTNHAQYLITKMLAAAFENICVVGDDAQSIYSFRGANIDNILNFEKDYPDAKIYKLEQNYRSTGHIVEAANSIISKNKNQLKKKIWTDNGQGELIRVIKTVSDNDEGRAVADSITENRLRNHFKHKDFAILYRTNAQSRAFEEALRRLNIPYKVFGGLSFYQRKEIKDLLAYLKLTVNHKDEEALRRIINYPARGIGDSTLEKITVLASDKETSLWDIMQQPKEIGLSGRASGLIAEFVTKIRSFAALLEKKNAFELAVYIAAESGLHKELYQDKSAEGISRYENLQELLNSIKEFVDSNALVGAENEGDITLGSYLQNVMLLTDADSDSKEGQDYISLMSIHSAKGLEFDVVYVVGLEEGLFPSAMSVSDRLELEEERRLFYVATTRARKKLFLTYASTRYRYGNLQYCEPSRFLEDINQQNREDIGHRSKAQEEEQNTLSRSWNNIAQNLRPLRMSKPADHLVSGVSGTAHPDFIASDPALFQTGQQVEHPKFGLGKIVSMEGNQDEKIATVFFNDLGQKRILLRYAKLRIL